MRTVQDLNANSKEVLKTVQEENSTQTVQDQKEQSADLKDVIRVDKETANHAATNSQEKISTQKKQKKTQTKHQV